MALPQAGVELVAQGLSGFVSDMGKANTAVAGFGDTGAKAGGTFKSGFGEIVTGALREIGALAVDALGKAAQATGAFLTDSIGKAGDFQQGMLEFQAVAGKDVDTSGLDKFHDLFIQLGKDLPVSTADVQKAAIEMVKGGIDPATIASGGLKQNIQFAAAAMGGDLVQAAEVSAKILGGWSSATATAAEKSDFLTHSTDMLTKAANASSVDVHELSLGIFNAQGTAKAAGVSFDDLTTTLAELAPRFASSSEAGNSLKNMIARLQPQTKNQVGAMQALGLYTEATGSAFYDAQGNFVGFQKASELLRNATKDLTNEQRAQMLQTIFGNDAMGSASALAELGAEGYTAMAAALDKANGVQANAALKQQGYNTALENAKGSIEALQITLGEKLLPVLTTVLNDYIAPGINMVTAFADAFFAAEDPVMFLADQVMQFSPALGALVLVIGDLITSGGNFETVLYDLSEGFGVNLDGIQSFASFIGDNLTPILTGLGTAILVAVIPPFVAWAAAAGTAAVATIAALAPVIVPIVAIGAAAALLAKAWDSDWLGIRGAVTDFWNKYGAPIFSEVKTWLATNIPTAVSTASTFFTGTLLPAITSIWTFLKTYVIPLFVALFRVEFEIAKLAVMALAGLWQKTLWPALQNVWSFIDKNVLPIFKDVGKFITDTFGPVLNNLSSWIDRVTGGFEGIGNAVKSVISFFNDLADKISKLKLPAPFNPGSPTPFEIGLRGISDALKTEVNPQIKALWSTLQVAPVASPAQILGAAAGNNTTYNQQRTLNMPVYTNMSPAAIQSSGAIANALIT